MQGNGCKSEKITIKSEADTRAFGLRLAHEATQGSVLAMIFWYFISQKDSLLEAVLPQWKPMNVSF